MIVLRALIPLLLLLVAPAHARETIRQGAPKPCYIFSWGKGPRWIAPVAVEFQENHFQWEQPYVDDSLFEPTGEALKWRKKELDPKHEEIGRANGRRILKIEYRYEQVEFLWNNCVMLAIETAENSGWFSPFYVVCPQRFAGQFVSGRDVIFGYVATLSFSGTGAYRTHHLFDLKGEHPKLLRTVNSGGIKRRDFDTDADFERARKMPNDEEAILRGELAGEGKATDPRTENKKGGAAEEGVK